MSIEVFNESNFLSINEESLVDVASFALARMDVHPDVEVNIQLVDLDTMSDMHMRWMNLPGPTDVMSFPMDDDSVMSYHPNVNLGPTLLGDIAICPEFAAKQAVKAGHPLGHELVYLTVHGCLHLLGYDHRRPDEEQRMFALQNMIVADWYDDIARRGIEFLDKPVNPGAFPTAADRAQLEEDMAAEGWSGGGDI